MIEVLNPAEFLHLVDCDRPADEVNNEGQGVKPMIVSVEFFLASVHCLFQGLDLALIEYTLHCLHVLVLDQALLVHLLQEGISEDEREGDRGNEGDDSCPDDHGSAEHVVAVDRSDEDALNGPVDENDGCSGKARKELIVGEMVQRVKGTAGPIVILEVFIINLNVDAVGDEEEEPVKEGPEPGEPQGNAFSEMSLELDNVIDTFPVVIVEAQHNLAELLANAVFQFVTVSIVVCHAASVELAAVTAADGTLQMKFETKMLLVPILEVYH